SSGPSSSVQDDCRDYNGNDDNKNDDDERAAAWSQSASRSPADRRSPSHPVAPPPHDLVALSCASVAATVADATDNAVPRPSCLQQRLSMPVDSVGASAIAFAVASLRRFDCDRELMRLQSQVPWRRLWPAFPAAAMILDRFAIGSVSPCGDCFHEDSLFRSAATANDRPAGTGRGGISVKATSSTKPTFMREPSTLR
ncbi:hypothetical protein DFJ73DRAFT_834514, partial [Zopfochytrium polystomum]